MLNGLIFNMINVSSPFSGYCINLGENGGVRNTIYTLAISEHHSLSRRAKT